MTEQKIQQSAAGRPTKEINWSVVDQCLHAGAPGTRIAGYLGIHPDTLYRAVKREHEVEFADYAAQKHAKGEMMLEMKQFQEAMKGDRGMLIWLGKQRLGQKENHDLKISGDGFIAKVVNFGAKENPIPYQSDSHSSS